MYFKQIFIIVVFLAGCTVEKNHVQESLQVSKNPEHTTKTSENQTEHTTKTLGKSSENSTQTQVTKDDSYDFIRGNSNVLTFASTHQTQIFQQAKIQLFTCSVDKKQIIQTEKGIKFTISPESFVDSLGKPVKGEVKILVKEALTLKDMINSRLTTVSNGEILISGGMFHIEAQQNGQILQLAAGKEIQTEVLCADKELKIFTGEIKKDAELNWNLTNTEPSFETVGSSDFGCMQRIFGFEFPFIHDKNVYIRWKVDHTYVQKKQQIDQYYIELRNLKKNCEARKIKHIQDLVQSSFYQQMIESYPILASKTFKFSTLQWKNEQIFKRLGLQVNDPKIETILQFHRNMFVDLQKSDSISNIFENSIQAKKQEINQNIVLLQTDIANRMYENLNTIAMFRDYHRHWDYTNRIENTISDDWLWSFTHIPDDKNIKILMSNLLFSKELPSNNLAVGLQKIEVIAKKSSYKKVIAEKLSLIKNMKLTRKEFNERKKQFDTNNTSLSFNIKQMGYYNLDKFMKQQMFPIGGVLANDNFHQESEVFLVGLKENIVLKAKVQNGKFKFNYPENKPFVIIVMNEKYGFCAKKYDKLSQPNLGTFSMAKMERGQIQEELDWAIKQ